MQERQAYKNSSGVNRSGHHVFWVLILGFILQFVTALVNHGYFHPDQHFQLVEFAMEMLGEPHAAQSVWERDEAIRPTLAVYLYTGLHEIFSALGITDRYNIYTAVRVLLSSSLWLVSMMLVYRAFGKKPRVLLTALILSNFLWFLPYIRTLFSSEMLGSLFFLIAVFLISKKDEKSLLRYAVIGLILSLSFYMRFQMAFAFVGLAIWMFFELREWLWPFLALGAGFIVGVALNTALDSHFYGYMVCTPYEYFDANIIRGVASSFGTSPFYFYLVETTLMFSIPLFSIVVFFFFVKDIKKHWKSLFFLSFLFFLIAHSLVAHKEERFLYPVLPLIPLFTAEITEALTRKWKKTEKALQMLVGSTLVLGLLLNAIALYFFAVIGYAQPQIFLKKLNDHVAAEKRIDPGRDDQLFALKHSPLETPSGLPLVYYSTAIDSTDILKIGSEELGDVDCSALMACRASEYDRLMEASSREDWEEITYSSEQIWKLNRWLVSQGLGGIPDLWILLRRKC